MKTSQFRHWLNEKWFEHKEEMLNYGAESFPDAATYFRRYKWWLKTVFQKEQQQNKAHNG